MALPTDTDVRIVSDSTEQTAGLPVTEDAFWEIIEAAKRESDRCDSQGHAARLQNKLQAQTVEEIVSFQGWIEYFIDCAYTAETHGAHILITDGDGSDDGFLYFRTWLVGQGELLYKSAVADPDLLADRLHAATNPIDQTDGELLRYAASRACQAITKLRDWDEGWPLDYDVIDAFVETQKAQAKTSGGQGAWIDDADLPKRFPRLAAKCEDLWSRIPDRPRNRVMEKNPDGSFVVRYRPADVQGSQRT